MQYSIKSYLEPKSHVHLVDVFKQDSLLITYEIDLTDKLKEAVSILEEKLNPFLFEIQKDKAHSLLTDYFKDVVTAKIKEATNDSEIELLMFEQFYKEINEYAIETNSSYAFYKPFDCLELRLNATNNAWQLYCTEDFEVQNERILEGDVGGYVDNPYCFVNRPSWIKENYSTGVRSSLLDGSYITANSYIKNSVIIDSTVSNRASVQYSVVINSNISGGDVNGCRAISSTVDDACIDGLYLVSAGIYNDLVPTPNQRSYFLVTTNNQTGTIMPQWLENVGFFNSTLYAGYDVERGEYHLSYFVFNSDLQAFISDNLENIKEYGELETVGFNSVASYLYQRVQQYTLAEPFKSVLDKCGSITKELGDCFDYSSNYFVFNERPIDSLVTREDFEARYKGISKRVVEVVESLDNTAY